MRFFTPYILILLFVFTTEYNFSQNFEGKNEMIIDSLISNGNFDEAELLIRQSIINKKEALLTNYGVEFFKLSILNEKKGMYSLALQKADSALYYFTLDKSQHEIAETFLSKGMLYNLLNNYIDAFTSLKKAEIIFKAEKDTLNLGVIKMNMGNIHSNMFNIEESANYYHEAIQYFEWLKLEGAIGNCYNNIGNLYHKNNLLDSSKLYYEKTLAIAVKANSTELLSTIYHNIGLVHLAKKDYASALFYTNKSIKINTKVSSFVNLQNNYLV